jgi:hypothetical protein
LVLFVQVPIRSCDCTGVSPDVLEFEVFVPIAPLSHTAPGVSRTAAFPRRQIAVCVALFVAVGALGTHTPAVAADDQWGDFRGRFVFDGTPPVPAVIEPTQDKAVCGEFNLRGERLIVDAKTKGIANIIVWIDEAVSNAAVPVHPSYNETQSDDILLDNKECRFQPRVVLVRVTQTLVIGNSDPVSHNAFVAGLRNRPFNPVVPPNATANKARIQLTKAEKVPIEVKCSIHGWMNAYILVQSHPYAAVTSADGSFHMKFVPAGRWTLRAWHESIGFIGDPVTRDGKSERWVGGKDNTLPGVIPITIETGENDWGTVTIPASVLVDEAGRVRTGRPAPKKA